MIRRVNPFNHTRTLSKRELGSFDLDGSVQSLSGLLPTSSFSNEEHLSDFHPSFKMFACACSSPAQGDFSLCCHRAALFVREGPVFLHCKPPRLHSINLCAARIRRFFLSRSFFLLPIRYGCTLVCPLHLGSPSRL